MGESFYVPEKRFLVHKEGGKLAARCNRRMLCLLPSLYEHLNPLSRTEAKELEPKIAQELQDLMIKTKWG